MSIYATAEEMHPELPKEEQAKLDMEYYLSQIED